MPISYPQILDLHTGPRHFQWTERETMLYALGIGMCPSGVDPDELVFVTEPGLVAMPTFATMIAWGPNLETEIAAGLTFDKIVHAGQKVELHRPLPAEGSIVSEHRVLGIADKGAGKGAFLTTGTFISLEDGAPLATLTSTVAARADGGFGGPRSFGAPPHPMPDRAPDTRLRISTRPDQALLYRLSGDRTPLHAKPDVARAAGFPGPILHGLCTFGISCRAVMSSMLGYDASLIASHEARFIAPVLPGETLVFDLWRDGDVISFEAATGERGGKVLAGGRTQIRKEG